VKREDRRRRSKRRKGKKGETERDTGRLLYDVVKKEAREG
jgi:hypothetical protein